MADRNPFIPSERRQDVEGRTNIIEDEGNRRFAEKQAELQQKTNKAAAQQAVQEVLEQAEKKEEGS